MRPIVNPYRDKERLADLDGGFGSKVKKGVPHFSSRVLLGAVLLFLVVVLYYTHHVHYAHLLVKDKPSIRGSFSDSVKEFEVDIQNDLRNIDRKNHGLPIVDMHKKDNSEPRSGKINSLKGPAAVKESYSPALIHKLQEESMHAGAIEDKILALAALSKQNELKIAAEEARREKQRENERLAAEAEALRLEQERKAAEEAERAAAEHQAALLLQQEQAAKVEAAQKEAKAKAEKRAAQEAADQEQAQALAEKRAAQIDAERRAAQLEADALLAKRADEQRQAAVRAQEEETLKAAEAAAAAQQPHNPDEPIGILAPPPDDQQHANALPVQDGPIGVLAPPTENPPLAAGDVAPVVNIDSPEVVDPFADNPVPERGQMQEEAAVKEAALLQEQNLGHPAVPPEADEGQETPAVPAVPVVPIVPLIPAVVPPSVPEVPVSPEVPSALKLGSVDSLSAVDSAKQDSSTPIVALHPPAQPVEALSVPGLPASPTNPALPVVPALPALPALLERPMGYDLSPDVLARMESANAAKTSALANSLAGAEKIDYCAGNVDPFASTPVDAFDPPASADFEIVAEWRSAVASMRNRVSKVRYGGDELRALIKNEIKDLQKMRFKMFCKYA